MASLQARFYQSVYLQVTSTNCLHRQFCLLHIARGQYELLHAETAQGVQEECMGEKKSRQLEQDAIQPFHACSKRHEIGRKLATSS